MRCGARRLARAARGSEPGDIDATRCAMGRKQPCPHPDTARDRARGLRCGDGGRSEQGQCVFGGRAGVLRYMRVRTVSSLALHIFARCPRGVSSGADAQG